MNTATSFRSGGLRGVSGCFVNPIRSSLDASELTGDRRRREALPWPQSFLMGTLTAKGIAESVKQLVAKRSAALSLALRQRMEMLANLEPNWDDEGAAPVKSFVLADAVEVLKRLAQQTDGFQEPFIAPTFDGYVQMEWHGQKRSLELAADSHGWTIVGTLIKGDGKRDYFTGECARSDFEQLGLFYKWFMGIELIWPSL